MMNNKLVTSKKYLYLLLLYLFLKPFSIWAQEESVKVTLKLEDVSLKTLFEEIQKQSNYSFVYNSNDALKLSPITIDVKKQSVKSILETAFNDSDFIYKIEGNIISIKYQPKGKVETANNEKLHKKVSGMVTDSKNLPIPGASVWLIGTNIGSITNVNGNFTLSIPTDTINQLRFSFMGLKTQDIRYEGQSFIEVVMEDDMSELSEIAVIANGMFTRNTETYTGAAVTYDKESLKGISNQNIFASLKVLDPAFNITESVEFGSDPNRMPDIQLRGPTSLNVDINGEYETSPNQPLFILNGFEASIEKVYDIDMNLVSSITILKDAAAKAIYGSKAANGVAVIETLQPEQGKLRANYNGSLDLTIPDLTSYNLTNSAEKLQAEVLAGKYTSSNAYSQVELTRQYNELMKEVERGVDSYWLPQPLRLGLGQKHSLYLDGGDEAMRYSASVGYNNIAGVMKGSTRTTISGNIVLAYRYKKLSFRNMLSIDDNKAKNSPYGDFSEYSQMNPYYRIHDENGNLIKQYNTSVYNPLYNAQQNSKDETKYTLITENFYGEWNISDQLKFTGRFGYTKNMGEGDVYIPASNTQYANISPSSDEYLLRGQYTKTNSRSNSLNLDFGTSYSVQKNKHQIFSNLMYSMEQSITESNGMVAVGFPSDKMDYISFARQYLEGGSPSGSENTVRSVGVIGSVNYSFDNRFLADVSYRLNGSSMFGANERWGQFWSAGVGWNMHQETFMKNISALNMLKLRASLGYTGSQNFNSYQAISTYNYITNKTYNGDMGVNLIGLANENLQWQQVFDKNIGLDMAWLNNRLSVRFDLYQAITSNLLTDVTLPPSTGFTSYRENLGETENKGFEISINYRVWSNASTRSSVNVFFNTNHNTNKIKKISDALKKLNEQQDEAKESNGGTDDEVTLQQTPSIRYEEGQSMTAIWAVRSMGIDPITGQEVFLKKDGSTTYEWSVDDQVVVGDATPKFRGNFGSNLRHKGFDVSFAFTYQLGRQTYNSTLVEKVENVDVLNNNVDKRVLTDRWNTPGQSANFKSITDYSITKPTSRFVEDLNELVLSSINLGYDFSQMNWVQKSPLDYFKISFNMNDVARISSVKQEFGLTYPRGRVMSFMVQARF